MIIALFIHPSKDTDIVLYIKDLLEKNGVKVVIEDDQAKKFDCPPLSSIKPEAIDFLISMGGDGTILRLVHQHPLIDAPIIGVNLGGLGFMAAVPSSEIFNSINEILRGEYKIEKRLMLEGETASKEKCFAVNEMVIHRAQNPHLVELSISIDGTYINTFAADGIIVSTPSGSTAYSLASGGPILTPELEALVITPICPHTISNKPIVIPANKEIQIQYMGEEYPVEVTFDGISKFHMNPKETFRIRRSKRDFRLVHLKHQDYFSTLRSKLGWTGKLKGHNND